MVDTIMINNASWNNSYNTTYIPSNMLVPAAIIPSYTLFGIKTSES